MEQDKDLDDLVENNRKWVQRLTLENPDYFVHRSAKHTPKWLFIGCSDARVPAELMLGLEPGDLFVHRNIANQVVNTDTNCASVIEYAVNHLKVKHILVCGHYGCGGVKYSLQNEGGNGMIDYWMRGIRDVYRLHAQELDEFKEKDAKMRRLVELNVAEQVINIFKTPSVQHSVKNTAYPRVHGLVYDIETGYINNIGIESVTDPLHRFDHVFQFTKAPVHKNPHHKAGRTAYANPETVLAEVEVAKKEEAEQQLQLQQQQAHEDKKITESSPSLPDEEIDSAASSSNNADAVPVPTPI
jgi:carbonic anhydrase